MAKKRLAAFILVAGFCLLLLTIRTEHSPIIKGTLSASGICTLSASDTSQIETAAGKCKREVLWRLIRYDFANKHFKKLASDANYPWLKLQIITAVSQGFVRIEWGSSPTNITMDTYLIKGTNGWEEDTDRDY